MESKKFYKDDLKNQFFIDRYFTDLKYDDISKKLKVERTQLTQWEKEFDIEQKDEITKIRRLKSLYNNKKNLEGFELRPFPKFYEWYTNQFKIQNGNCYYCNTPEIILRELVENKIINSKRNLNRGHHLEIERKDSEQPSIYSKGNCVLACFICNNHKSDVISEKAFKKYFSEVINKYLMELKETKLSRN